MSEAILQSRAYYCTECGKCTGICPISRGLEYSPRRFVRMILEGMEDVAVRREEIWSCLTCKLCGSVCPSTVDYIELIKNVRGSAFALGLSGKCSQAGLLHTISRMMTKDKLEQSRLFWVNGDISEKGEILYFVGCLPYFDSVFSELKINTLSIAKSAIQIMNAIGIIPVVSNGERCCGHDLLWSGDFKNFEILAIMNIKEFKKAGISKIITSCAECYRTLKVDYRRFGADFDVVHLSEFMFAEREKIRFDALDYTVTYQDPCRLGRWMEVYEEPRKIIERCANFVEMERVRKGSFCCGVGSWMNCGAHSLDLQISRIEEACMSGAEVMITCCPKCQIHFTCALQSKDPRLRNFNIKLMDLTNLAHEALRNGL
jgi:Fe-S oxidoreductase